MTPQEVVAHVSRFDMVGPLEPLQVRFTCKPLKDTLDGRSRAMFKMNVRFRTADDQLHEFYSEFERIISFLDSPTDVADVLKALFIDWVHDAFCLSLLFRGKTKLLVGS